MSDNGLLLLMSGQLDELLDSQSVEDEAKRRALNVLLTSFMRLWYFDNRSPLIGECMRIMCIRFCVNIELQFRDEAAAKTAADAMLENCDIDISTVNQHFSLWAVTLRKLRDACRRYKIIGDSSDAALDAEERVTRLMEIMKDGRDSLVSSMLTMRKMNVSTVQDPLPPQYDTSTTMSKEWAEKLVPFQKLIIHLLDLMRQNRLRKFGSHCFKEILTGSGKPTHAWREVMSIREFLYANVTKEIDYEMWKNLTVMPNNDKQVVENLRDSSHPEFPLLTPKRELFAFGDDDDGGGLYSLDDDCFWPYACQDNWPEYGRRVTEERVRSGTYPVGYCTNPPDRSDVAIKHFPKSFKEAWKGVHDEYCDDPMSLPTPSVDKIFDDQQLTHETKQWVYALLGRLLYNTGAHDNWQALLFFKGIAGSGKSTVAKLMRYVYPPSLVASLSSNVEPRFGLAPLYDKFLVICAEVKRDFGMNQGDLQSAVSGEEVSVAIKNKDAKTVLWTTPFLFCGNELAAWKDSAGSMKRRLVIVEFNEVVRPDPELYDRMMGEFPAFLRKINLCYQEKAFKHSRCDLWAPDVLPPQMHEFAKKMRDDVDLFQGFINSPKFRFDLQNPSETFMPLSEIRDMYAQWRRENGYPSERWHSDTYLNAFREKGVFKGHSRETRTYEGRSVTGDFVYGICLDDDASM